jgi:hypothetical protein
VCSTHAWNIQLHSPSDCMRAISKLPGKPTHAQLLLLQYSAAQCTVQTVCARRALQGLQARVPCIQVPNNI